MFNKANISCFLIFGKVATPNLKNIFLYVKNDGMM